jgi:hypothetical protein
MKSEIRASEKFAEVPRPATEGEGFWAKEARGWRKSEKITNPLFPKGSDPVPSLVRIISGFGDRNEGFSEKNRDSIWREQEGKKIFPWSAFHIYM